ncbi:response regulator [Novosphingobium lentum]|uniref:response regulator n=1 Tax=Novosphingobium lentum TaxID=145287 RepID=UPI0008368CF7|nr:response regulator [Novosphingobium lentum]
MRILVVEDEPLLAMLLEENILELGHQPVAVAATVEQALAALDRDAVDCALLDFSLGHNATSVPVAERLRSDGTPFCYLSGHSSLDPDGDIPPAPLLTKPVSMATLKDALLAMAVAA